MSHSELQALPNIGPRLAEAFNRVGISTAEQLRSREPHQVQDEVGRIDERYRDPCVLDTLEAVIDHLNGSPPVPWWVYSRLRKAQA
jgi:hypothetical protein